MLSNTQTTFRVRHYAYLYRVVRLNVSLRCGKYFLSRSDLDLMSEACGGILYSC